MVIKIFIFLIFFLLLLIIFLSARIPKKKIFLFNSVLISLIILSLFLFYNYNNKQNINSKYNPPEYDGESIKPGFFSEKNK